MNGIWVSVRYLRLQKQNCISNSILITEQIVFGSMKPLIVSPSLARDHFIISVLYLNYFHIFQILIPIPLFFNQWACLLFHIFSFHNFRLYLTHINQLNIMFCRKFVTLLFPFFEQWFWQSFLFSLKLIFISNFV